MRIVAKPVRNSMPSGIRKGYAAVSAVNTNSNERWRHKSPDDSFIPCPPKRARDVSLPRSGKGERVNSMAFEVRRYRAADLRTAKRRSQRLYDPSDKLDSAPGSVRKSQCALNRHPNIRDTASSWTNAATRPLGDVTPRIVADSAGHAEQSSVL